MKCNSKSEYNSKDSQQDYHHSGPNKGNKKIISKNKTAHDSTELRRDCHHSDLESIPLDIKVQKVRRNVNTTESRLDLDRSDLQAVPKNLKLKGAHGKSVMEIYHYHRTLGILGRRIEWDWRHCSQLQKKITVRGAEMAVSNFKPCLLLISSSRISSTVYFCLLIPQQPEHLYWKIQGNVMDCCELHKISSVR